MVRSALVAHGRRHDDGMAEGEAGVECPGTPARDERPAAVVDRLLEEQRRERRADAGLEEGDALAAVL